MTKEKTVVVVGAGVAGLTAIKSCLEENLRVICFEQTEDIGGLWRYRQEVVDGQGCVMRSTVLNTSKEMNAFSDFPPPSEFPNYMHNSYMLEYLRLYAQKFGLLDHIQFSHQVVSVTRSEDFVETGQWWVRVRDTRERNGEVEALLVDSVMVCTGHHAYPSTPSVPGLEHFRNQVMHSHGYRKPRHFDGKTVLVLGSGNSGVDVAVELSLICKQVYFSTRSGCWILHRLGPNGEPLDCYLVRRYLHLLMYVLPFSLRCSFLEYMVNRRFNHELYNLKPKHRILEQYPTTCDRLPCRILSGTVAVKGDVATFTEHGVIFEGEEKEYDIDCVIMATGYDVKFPFLAKDVFSLETDLYRLILPPKLEKPTLGIMGLAQPYGAYLPMAEMQCRWFIQVIRGKVKLPPKDEMLRETGLACSKSSKNVAQVFWIPYLDKLAKDIGVEPDFPTMLLGDTKLFRHCVMGPCLPYQYRLRGPHSWKEARSVILTTRERIWHALQTRKTAQRKQVSQDGLPKVFIGFMSIIFMVLLVAMVV